MAVHFSLIEEIPGDGSSFSEIKEIQEMAVDFGQMEEIPGDSSSFLSN